MPTEAEHEERAIWKLEEGGYQVRRKETGYLVTASDGAETAIDDLAQLRALADAVYHRVWTGRRMPPSA